MKSRLNNFIDGCLVATVLVLATSPIWFPCLIVVWFMVILTKKWW